VRVGRVERAPGPRVFAHRARDESELSRLGGARLKLIRRAHAELRAEGSRAIRHELWLDMRYRGQSYELEIALTPRFVATSIRPTSKPSDIPPRAPPSKS